MLRRLISRYTILITSVLLAIANSNKNVFWFLKLAFFTILFISLLSIFTILSPPDILSVYQLKEYQPSTPSKLLDRNGKLISTFFTKNRIIIQHKDISPKLIQAFIAMEDSNFYSHYGFDIQAILRAFLTNLQHGSVRQGGSTMTQQLTKIILTDRKKTYTRKIKELLLAIIIEYLYTKEEILQLYFNQIYFGHGNYGAEAASLFYFKKSAKDVSIGEAAILASLPAAPNGYSPIKHPKRSLHRVAHVFMKMIDQNFIDIETALHAFTDIASYYVGLNIAPSSTAYGLRDDNAPYFTEYMRQLLSKEVGANALYNDGFTIYSSLDLEHQKIANNIFSKAIKKQNEISYKSAFKYNLALATSHSPVIALSHLLFEIPEFKVKKNLEHYKIELKFQREIANKIELLNLASVNLPILDTFLLRQIHHNPFNMRLRTVQGAFIEMDNLTGEVTVMIGGTNFSTRNQINRSVSAYRQPGSTFKAFIFASAIDKKIVTAATIFPDSPMLFLDEEGESWTPKNYGKQYSGYISLRKALTYSANMVSLAVVKEAGLSNLLPILSQCLHTPMNSIPNNLSIALGSHEVTPLQMIHAFSLFPRGGKDIALKFYDRIVNSHGKVIKQNKISPENQKQILQPSTSKIMLSLLEDVVDKGTGKFIRIRSGYKGYAAGKTGTSQNYRDAWFVGTNHRYTSSVWLGYDKSYYTLGVGQTGGSVAAPIWGDYQHRLNYMYSIKRKVDVNTLIPEAKNHRKSIVEAMICQETGKVYNPACPCNEPYQENFALNTVPNDTCDSIFQSKQVTTPLVNQSAKHSSKENFFQGDDDL